MNLQKENQNGAVLLTVLVIIMVLTVVVISIMSVSLSQVKSGQQVIDEVKTEYLSEGFFYKYHQEMISTGSASLPDSDTIILDGKEFSVTGNQMASSSGDPNPNDTTRVELQIDF